MNRSTRWAALALAIAPFAAWPQGWQDGKGMPRPNNESHQARDGFAGSVEVVTDADWRAKWDTPSSTVPNFNRARDVAKGQKVFVLVFFANPLPSAQGEVDVRCDLDLDRPDGGSALHQVDVPCFKGRIAGSLTNTYLSDPVVQFNADPPDPVGDWTMRVTLRDAVRQTSLSLKTAFHVH